MCQCTSPVRVPLGAVSLVFALRGVHVFSVALSLDWQMRIDCSRMERTNPL